MGKFRVDWYVDVHDEESYMGCNYFIGTEDQAWNWAYEHCEGFEYDVVEVH